MCSSEPSPPDEALRAATRLYLRGEPIDMSALAVELGVSRATLYRRVGKHEHLLAHVLAERTARTFAAAEAAALLDDPDESPDRAVSVFATFLRTVVDAVPLQALIARDPALFARVAMAPGPVESTATTLVVDLLHREVHGSGATLRQPAPVIARAMVRLGYSFMYTHLLSGGPSQLDEAIALISLLLEAAVTPVG